MKKILFTFLLLCLTISCKPQSPTYIENIQLFQYKLNTEYADAATSPLTKEDLKTFKTLDFFEIDENYRVEATLELTPESPIFEMKTTTDRLSLYKKYAIARFTLNGKDCELSLYQNIDLMNKSLEYADYLFLPFNDASNGKTTYGGGRFIIEIDFNKAYNPYCAYNHNYSCPIPPDENNLNILVNAGVKDFAHH
jgi:hypothetical protein